MTDAWAAASRSPECANDPSMCRITATRNIREPKTVWTPVYNAAGRQTNADPNVYIARHRCAACAHQWDINFQAGVPPVVGAVVRP
jgi:hypothetical protein